MSHSLLESSSWFTCRLLAFYNTCTLIATSVTDCLWEGVNDYMASCLGQLRLLKQPNSSQVCLEYKWSSLTLLCSVFLLLSLPYLFFFLQIRLFSVNKSHLVITLTESTNRPTRGSTQNKGSVVLVREPRFNSRTISSSQKHLKVMVSSEVHVKM